MAVTTHSAYLFPTFYLCSETMDMVCNKTLIWTWTNHTTAHAHATTAAAATRAAAAARRRMNMGIYQAVCVSRLRGSRVPSLCSISMPLAVVWQPLSGQHLLFLNISSQQERKRKVAYVKPSSWKMMPRRLWQTKRGA